MVDTEVVAGHSPAVSAGREPGQTAEPGTWSAAGSGAKSREEKSEFELFTGSTSFCFFKSVKEKHLSWLCTQRRRLRSPRSGGRGGGACCRWGGGAWSGRRWL